MKNLFFFVVTLSCIFATANSYSQTCKNYIGIEFYVIDSAFTYPSTPYTDSLSFIEYAEGSGMFISKLNNIFSQIGIEFYAHQYHFTANKTDPIMVELFNPPNPTLPDTTEKYFKVLVGGNDIGCCPGATNFFPNEGYITIYRLDTVGYHLRATVHETGHNFTLPHTFTNPVGFREEELVVRPGEEQIGDLPANCDYAGDLVCDTEADRWSTTCTFNSSWGTWINIDANGDTIDCRNYKWIMDYSNTSLDFSQQQLSIMKNNLERKAANFKIFNINAPYNVKPDFNFDHQNTDCLLSTNNVLVNFSNTTTIGAGSTVTSYFWETPFSTSSDTAPSFTFPSAGTYPVSLTVNWTNSGNNYCSSISKEVVIKGIKQVPFLLDFESASDLEQINLFAGAYYVTDPKTIYYDIDQYAYSLSYQFQQEHKKEYYTSEMTKTSLDFCVDSNGSSTPILSFKSKAIDTTSSQIKLFINQVQDTIITPTANWEEHVIDLSDYPNQILNIKFEMDRSILSNTVEFVLLDSITVYEEGVAICDGHTLTVDSVTDNSYKALVQLSSNALAPNGFDFEFSAGELIELNPEFNIPLGTLFLAKIDSCQLYNVSSTLTDEQ